MSKKALLATALGLSACAIAANAQAGYRPSGWYAGIEGGVNWIDNADVKLNTGFGGTTFEAGFDSGWALLAQIGYRWENNWRIELEAGWRRNDVDCIDFGGSCVSADWGDVSQFTQMINFVHDIDVSPHTALSIGLGLGSNYVQADSPFLHEQDFAFAGQALFQLAHELIDGLDVVLSYRFMRSADPEFVLSGPVSVAFENENHTVTVGLRFDLQPDAAPMATAETSAVEPPAPASAKQFIVYFGLNNTKLNAGAQAVVAEAAAAATHDGAVSILVTGHTDTAGPTGYNQRLSERRADVVKKALVARGVAEKAITAAGKGESVLIVQTGDNKAESRNRRATIDIN